MSRRSQTRAALALVTLSALVVACSDSAGESLVESTLPGAVIGAADDANVDPGQEDRVVLTDVSALVKEVSGGVVSVTQSRFRLTIEEFVEAELVPVGTGTGIVIDNAGHVLTNFHVIAGAESVLVIGQDGVERPAQVIGEAADFDLALLELSDFEGLVPIPFGSSAALEVGDPVVAIGNALGLDVRVPSVSVGIVSATSRTIRAPGDLLLRGLLQTDAAINSGNSGGPLLNRSGEVIGVNTVIASDAQNVGFAIAIDDVRSVIDAFLAGEGGAYTGLELLANSPQRAAQLNLGTSDGVVVFDLSPGPGSTGGIQRGDVIVEADGVPVNSPAELNALIADAGPGAVIELGVIRGTTELVATLLVGERPVRISRDP